VCYGLAGVIESNPEDTIVLNMEATDYRSNFAKTILFALIPVFRKYLSVSRWNLPGYFSVSFRFPQVTEQIDGELPRRFFLSALLSLVISMTGRPERSARALRDGADIVREAIGN